MNRTEYLSAEETRGTVLDLGRMLGGLKRGFWFILMCTLLGGLLLAGYKAWKDMPKYRTTVSFYVSSTDPAADAKAMSQLAEQYAVNMRDNNDLLTRAIDRYKLHWHSVFNNLKSSLQVEHPADTQNVNVTVTLWNASNCLRAAQGLAEVVPQYYQELMPGSYAVLTSDPVADARLITADVKGSLKKGLLAGLLAGLIITVLLNLMDRKIYVSKDIAENLDGRLLGTIPDAEGKKAGELKDRVRLVRTLTDQIVRSSGRKTVVITGPDELSGKSFMAKELASSFAESGQRTLLIDANAHAPVLAGRLGVEAAPGLSDCLTKESTISASAVVPENEKFYLLPHGSDAENISKLLDSAAGRALMEEAEKEFDVILFDMPQGLKYAEPIMASGMGGPVLLVAMRGTTDIRKLRALTAKIRESGNQEITYVLNEFTGGLAL